MRTRHAASTPAPRSWPEVCPIPPRCWAKAALSPLCAALSAFATGVVHQPSRAVSSKEAEIAVVELSCGVSAVRNRSRVSQADLQRSASAIPQSTSSPEGVRPGPRPMSAAICSARAALRGPVPVSESRLPVSAVRTICSALDAASAMPGCSAASAAGRSAPAVPSAAAAPGAAAVPSVGGGVGAGLMRWGRHMRMMRSSAAGSSSRSGAVATRSPIRRPAVKTAAGTRVRTAVGRS